MKATFIRHQGKRPSQALLTNLVQTIENRARELGFQTNAKAISLSAIHIAHRLNTFHIMPEKIGYNAHPQYDYHTNVAPWKKTRTPTWTQRCEFNNLINIIFNELELSANIGSGSFLLRKGLKPYVAADWDRYRDRQDLIQTWNEAHEQEVQEYLAKQREQHRPTKKQLIKYMNTNDLTVAEMLLSPKAWERKQVSRFKWSKR